MQSLCDELKIKIFKYLDTPIPIILTNRKWYSISQDPHARAEWLIYKYGKAHALFHAVRLGNNFITTKVVQYLLSKDAMISRYFMQRLLMNFGAYDDQLIKLKAEYNVNTIEMNKLYDLKKRYTPPWASDLPVEVFIDLMNKGCNILKDKGFAIKGNDMELFHFLSAGPLVINHAIQKLPQNIEQIKDLILNKKFVPFPPHPKIRHGDTMDYLRSLQARTQEEYPPKEGYENNRQLNVVTRAILIHPDLVNLWKSIGYHEICSDINELAIPGAFLILFPPSPPSDWECPKLSTVLDRLKRLVDIGFRLTH